jgi:hypothetical protein
MSPPEDWQGGHGREISHGNASVVSARWNLHLSIGASLAS